MPADPLAQSKEFYQKIIEKISVSDSPVGIDAQYTHAVIIAYLNDISSRLDALEQRLG